MLAPSRKLPNYDIANVISYSLNHNKQLSADVVSKLQCTPCYEGVKLNFPPSSGEGNGTVFSSHPRLILLHVKTGE